MLEVYVLVATWLYEGVRRVSRIRRDLALSVEDPTPIHISLWKIDSDHFSRTFWSNTRTKFLREGRSLFFSRLYRYVLCLLRRLRGPYVIPRHGVPRHIVIIYSRLKTQFRWPNNNSFLLVYDLPACNNRGYRLYRELITFLSLYDLLACNNRGHRLNRELITFLSLLTSWHAIIEVIDYIENS